MQRVIAVVVIVFLSIVLASCETQSGRVISSEQQASFRTDEDTTALLVGAWFGKYNREPDEAVEFITRHEADGSFIVRFRITDSNGSVSEHYEKGRWNVRGDIISKRTTEVEGSTISSPLNELGFYNDEYRIISLTQKTIIYEHIDYETVYTANRVADDFEFPVIKSTVKTSEPEPTLQPRPGRLSDQARSYIEQNGLIFVDRFDRVCSATNLKLNSIESEVEDLGWNVGQTRPSEKNIRRWDSFGSIAQKNTDRSEPIFILDVLLSASEEARAASCSLTMWGTSSVPDVGKQEFDLIAKDILPPTYQIGEVDKQVQELQSPFLREIQYTTYVGELRKLGEDKVRFFYRWFGGAHSLIAIRAD